VAEVLAAANADLSVEARMELAGQAQERGLPHHALLHLEAVEFLAPDLPGLAKAFGHALLGVGMVAEAVAKLEQAVSEDPEDRDGWRLVAALREERGDHVGCMDACLRAVLLGSDGAPKSSTRPTPSGSRSTSPISSRVPPRMAADAPAEHAPAEQGRGGSRTEPSRAPAQVLRLAAALLGAGSVLNAEKLYARQLQSPLAAQAHIGLARCACARGQCSQALPHLRAAQRLEPGHPDLRAAIQALLAAMETERYTARG